MRFNIKKSTLLGSLCLLCLTPLSVAALNIGGAKVQSHIGENLSVFVPLTNNGIPINLSDVKVTDATSDQRRTLSINELSAAQSVNYQIIGNGDRQGILITTNRPINEPFVNLAFQVEFQSSTRIKALPILLDLPGSNNQGFPFVTNSDNVGTSPTSYSTTSQLTSDPAVSFSESGNTESASITYDSTVYETSDVNSSAGYENSSLSINQGSNNSEVVTYGGDIMGPYDWAQEGLIPDKFGPVLNGQSLWRVARRINTAMGVSVDQMMWGIYRANRSAFSTENVNSLKSGVSLVIPEESFVREVTERQAIQLLKGNANQSVATTPVSNDFNVGIDGQEADVATDENALENQGEISTEEMQGGELLISSLDKKLLDTLNTTVTDLQEQLYSKDLEIEFLKDQIETITGVRPDYDAATLASNTSFSEGDVSLDGANVDITSLADNSADKDNSAIEKDLNAENPLATETGVIPLDIVDDELSDNLEGEIEALAAGVDQATEETESVVNTNIVDKAVTNDSGDVNSSSNIWKWILGALALIGLLFFLLRNFFKGLFTKSLGNKDDIVLNIPSVADTDSGTVISRPSTSGSPNFDDVNSPVDKSGVNEISFEDDDFLIGDGDVDIEEVSLSDRIRDFLKDEDFASARKTVEFAEEANIDSNYLDFCRLKIFAAEKDKSQFAKVFNRVNRRINDFHPDIQARIADLHKDMFDSESVIDFGFDNK